jgi:four helix bundle protein
LKTNNDHELPFEKLQTWHVAKDFAKRIYIVAKQFPSSEQYGLTSQIQRASVSVMSNIAEGTARISRKDQAHFSQLAYSSLMEAACQLQLAHEIGFVSVEDYSELREYVTELSIKINALRRSQLKVQEMKGS